MAKKEKDYSIIHAVLDLTFYKKMKEVGFWDFKGKKEIRRWYKKEMQKLKNKNKLKEKLNYV